LAAEFLKAAKPFIEEGVSPQLIIKAFEDASKEVFLFLIIFWFLRVIPNQFLLT